MSTLHSSFHSSPPGPMNVVVPTTASSLKQPPNSQELAGPKSVFVEDVLGYVYLCCQSNKARAELLSMSSYDGNFASLGRVSDFLSRHDLQPKTSVPKYVLQQVLTIAKIPEELWNAVLERVATTPSGRSLLDQANATGESLSLGLPADASPRLRKIERALQTSQFTNTESKRVLQFLNSHAARTVDPKNNKILLYAVKVRAASEIPPDGFSKHSFQFRWLLSAAFVKLRGALASLSTKKELADKNEHIRTAKHRTWLAPEGSSIQSPTIQALVKTLEQSHIKTTINAIPGVQGCMLELQFWISPGHMPHPTFSRRRS